MAHRHAPHCYLLPGLLCLACQGDAGGGSASFTASATTGNETGQSTTSTGSTTSATTASSSANTSASTTDATTTISFDVGSMTAGGDMGVPPPTCKVVDDMDAVGECGEKAPPDSFEPETQWDFMGPAGFEESIVTPLVANFTDDNNDGEIDLCDIPDVVVVAGPGGSDTPPSRIYVLDGETGVPHFFTTELVQFAGTPAVGDIDGDGLVEIVTSRPNGAAKLVAFEHDGSLKWESAATWSSAQSSAVALADVDADGDVEIIAGTNLFDHTGALVWSQAGDTTYSASAAADLDGDGQMEILAAHTIYRTDGSVYASLPGFSGWAHPQVANFDGDPEPEILYATNTGFTMFEHDGTQIYAPMAPTGATFDWNRPINIHNLDMDPAAEFGAADPSHYGVYDADGTLLWSADIVDSSGQAGGTAFDFIGAGVAQAIYADEYSVWVFDDLGSPLMEIAHKSGTVLEYPTVADIDNDGSSEILVVSNTVLLGGTVPFTVRAVRDIEDRWVQGRRIWNQHTYHVTNVREDGTIPQTEPKHWQLLNTYRTQAQIEGGGVCKPKPEG